MVTSEPVICTACHTEHPSGLGKDTLTGNLDCLTARCLALSADELVGLVEITRDWVDMRLLRALDELPW